MIRSIFALALMVIMGGCAGGQSSYGGHPWGETIWPTIRNPDGYYCTNNPNFCRPYYLEDGDQLSKPWEPLHPLVEIEQPSQISVWRGDWVGSNVFNYSGFTCSNSGGILNKNTGKCDFFIRFVGLPLVECSEVLREKGEQYFVCTYMPNR